MKSRLHLFLWTVTGLILLAAVLTVFLAEKHPVALLRVVNAAGQPVAGAAIRPEGMRSKPGPYSHGWYGWTGGPDRPTNALVRTGSDGYARVPYPKHVFERIETGIIIVSVDHPEYVPDRPECMVTTVLPAGAPWRERFHHWLKRLHTRNIVARTVPIVLQQGAVLRVARRSGSDGSLTKFFAQVSGVAEGQPNFWETVAPGVIMTRRLRAGSHTVRAVQINADGSVEFSEVASINATIGRTNEIALDLKPGVTVRGRIDQRVPRPVRNGRVIAQVWPVGHKPQANPPQWHTWAPLPSDGTFEIKNIPPGDFEIVAVCDGHVSTNGPGQFSSMHYPQKHLVGSNDVSITIGMEPTGSLEVEVLDEQGKAVPDAIVMAWPNVRYGEWSAVVLGTDNYTTADYLIGQGASPENRLERIQSFRSTTDLSGMTLMQNLTAEVKQLSIQHPKYALPAVVFPGGEKRRQVTVPVEGGATNRVTIHMHPANNLPISHY